MQTHIFLIIRYSFLSGHPKGWVINRDASFEEYKRILFDDERLALHQLLFQRLTLPSVMSLLGRHDNVSVIVVTSDQLPRAYLDPLSELVRIDERFIVLQLPPEAQFRDDVVKEMHGVLSRYDGRVCYASVRLDDDDALSDRFVDMLNPYMKPEFAGFCVSFPNGFGALFGEQDWSFLGFCADRTIMIGLGLSLVDVFDKERGFPRLPTVFHLGGHKRADQRAPVILESRSPVFIRSIHPESDVHRKAGAVEKRAKKSIDSMVDNGEVAKYFSFVDDDDFFSVATDTVEQIAEQESKDNSDRPAMDDVSETVEENKSAKTKILRKAKRFFRV